MVLLVDVRPLSSLERIEMRFVDDAGITSPDRKTWQDAACASRRMREIEERQGRRSGSPRSEHCACLDVPRAHEAPIFGFVAVIASALSMVGPRLRQHEPRFGPFWRTAVTYGLRSSPEARRVRARCYAALSAARPAD